MIRVEEEKQPLQVHLSRLASALQDEEKNYLKILFCEIGPTFLNLPPPILFFQHFCVTFKGMKIPRSGILKTSFPFIGQQIMALLESLNPLLRT